MALYVVNHKKRTELLIANGKNPRLIRDLLGDAQLWDLLRRNCDNQMAELMAFQESYRSQSWAVIFESDSMGDNQGDGVAGEFQRETNELKQKYSEGLKTLTETSRDLIQLVSIYHSCGWRTIANLS